MTAGVRVTVEVGLLIVLSVAEGEAHYALSSSVG